MSEELEKLLLAALCYLSARMTTEVEPGHANNDANMELAKEMLDETVYQYACVELGMEPR